MFAVVSMLLDGSARKAATPCRPNGIFRKYLRQRFGWLGLLHGRHLRRL